MGDIQHIMVEVWLQYELVMPQHSTAQHSTANTWGFSPIGLQGLGVGAQPLVLIHIHLISNVQVCAVEAGLRVIQNLHNTVDWVTKLVLSHILSNTASTAWWKGFLRTQSL